MIDKTQLEIWEKKGVRIIDPARVDIGKDVKIGKGTVVYPDNYLFGDVTVGEGVILREGNSLSNCKIGDGTEVLKSVIEDSEIGERTTVGPFAHVKVSSRVGNGCRIGNFVEIKNSVVGNYTKVAHLAYVGDCTLGQACNIGCGVIFINYDGEKKYRSTVGDKVFVGSNSNVIAPVNIGDGAYIAAGSTVDIDLPEHCLCIGRCRPVIKEWKSKYNPKEGAK